MELSRRSFLIFLLTTNGALICAGVSLVSFGIHRVVTAPRSLLAEMDSEATDGTLSIISGSIHIVIGFSGALGTVMTKRIFLLANGALLCFAICWNLITMIALGVSSRNAISSSYATIRGTIANKYGNTTGFESRTATLIIDEYQTLHRCCGWNGIHGDNLFAHSPWNKQANRAQKPASSPMTLPDSCCSGAKRESCLRATDIKEARSKGYVWQSDCMDGIIASLKVFRAATLVQQVLLTLLQLVMMAFLVMMILLGIKPDADD